MNDEIRKKLYESILAKGFPEDFCYIVLKDYLNTDYTAKRMIGYLSKFPSIKIEDFVDEMLAIIEERNRIVEKHRMLDAQAVMNDVYNNGLDDIGDR